MKIFVAGPFNHPDESIKESRLNKITEYCTQLFLNGMSPISPLLIGLNMAKFANLPTDTETWKVYSQTLLKGCDELHILMLDGWEKSKGVEYEIEAAKKMNITIKWIK
jgi:hypothetical protein